VVVACTSPASAALAAARGLPMLLGLHAGDDHKREMAACYGSAAPPGGPLPGHIAAVVAYVADTREQARRVLRQELPCPRSGGAPTDWPGGRRLRTRSPEPRKARG
jgi:alkanesulfonate monooxygenase SsuD/methylene tetrahydromethanopterin reductase-like flavin-dependent oxidoreductase (luciferase family)